MCYIILVSVKIKLLLSQGQRESIYLVLYQKFALKVLCIILGKLKNFIAQYFIPKINESFQNITDYICVLSRAYFKGTPVYVNRVDKQNILYRGLYSKL